MSLIQLLDNVHKMLIPSNRLETMKREISRLNNIAIKNGFDQIVYEITDEVIRREIEIETRSDGYSSFHKIWVNHTRVLMSLPTLSHEYTLLGKAEAVNDGHMFYGDTDLSSIEIHNKCGHCGHNLKHTFIVQKGDDIKQVGRECLKVHVGIDPKRIDWQLQIQTFVVDKGFDDALEGGNVGSARAVPVCEILRQVGFWEDRGLEWGAIKHALFDRELSKDIQAEMRKFEVGELCEQFTSYLESIEAPNGFQNNLITAYGDGEWAEFRFAATVGAGFFFWLKDLKRLKDKVQGHLGEIGKREIFEICFKDLTVKPNHFGYGLQESCTYIYKGEDIGGHEVVWFASRQAINRDMMDRFIKVKATVKDHITHPKYGDSTKLTRCSIVK